MKTSARITLSFLLALLATSFTHAGEKITYIHNDALGSPVAATNQQGQVIWRETYRPHGQRTTNAAASANNKVWFTGKQEESALGINYFGARWYHPEVGRFLVIDPVGVSPDNIHSFNRYGYANNNPYRFVDPDGRAAQVVAGGGLIILGGGAVAYGACGGSSNPWCNAVRGLGDRFAGDVKGGLDKLFNEGADADKGDQDKSDNSKQKPDGVPEHWGEQAGKKDGNTKWVNPDNPHDYVRKKPDGTVTQVRDGKAYDANGNRVDLKSPDAHGITPDNFIFRP